MKAFLKWAGGKRWLSSRYPELFTIPHRRFIEPFLGGGSIFLYLEPKKSIISDKNVSLVNLYRCIRDDPSKVAKLLAQHSKFHSVEYYYATRANLLSDRFERASQFLYLNRTCWNGLYRENLKGEFNVPKGTKDSVVFPDDDFQRASLILKRASIHSGDFSTTLQKIVADDFVFIDPPYTVRHNTNGFVKYNETIFSWEDQVRLARLIQEKSDSGASILVCNAFHESILDLYRGMGIVLRVDRSSVLSGEAKHRGTTNEAIILVGKKWGSLVRSNAGLSKLVVNGMPHEFDQDHFGTHAPN